MMGMNIPTLREVVGKMKLGLSLGAMSLTSVLFGLYGVKLVNIPLFLTFRRCAILATILVTYIVTGKGPSNTLAFCAFLMVGGALIAGYNTLTTDALGYILIWANNFS